MAESKNLLAFDCGNSTLRTILCRFDGKTIVPEVILSEPNEIIKVGKYFYWDVLHIFDFMKKGLEKTSHIVDKIDSAGVCTWGIDFMLFDEKDNMLSNALCYRNTIGAEEMEKQTPQEQEEMFRRTGILCDKINTVYMLKGMQEKMPAIMSSAKKLLMVPDILTYFMTGVMENEPSELSTSQLMDVRKMSICDKQCEVMGIDPTLFRKVGEHGKTVGNIKREILDEMKIAYDIPFVCTPSHDTASAVFGIPCRSDEYLFVSSGTWALIGAQIKEPILNDEVLNGRLTNEVGAFGRITLLKNSIGMFITQRLRTEYRRDINGEISWTDFTAISEKYSGKPPIFDVNDPSLFNPVHMAKAIHELIHPESPNSEYCWSEILASTYASLAESYCIGLRAVMNATKKQYDAIYVVGGGSRNAHINQACANSLGMNIITCDMECSSVGNAAVQLSGILPEMKYDDLREIIVSSLKTKTFYPEK